MLSLSLPDTLKGRGQIEGGQRGDSSLSMSPKPEQGPLGGLLDALGFHPQSYLGAMEGTWLSRSGRTEVLWDPREPHHPAPQKHLPNPGGVHRKGSQSQISFTHCHLSPTD